MRRRPNNIDNIFELACLSIGWLDAIVDAAATAVVVSVKNHNAINDVRQPKLTRVTAEAESRYE